MGTYFITTSGDGDNSGDSLSNAMTFAQSKTYASNNTSETIVFLMQAGDYGSFGVYDTPRTAWATWQADPSQGAEFVSSNMSVQNIGSGGTLREFYVKLDGLFFELDTEPANAGSYFFRTQASRYVIFENCTFHNSAGWTHDSIESSMAGLSINYSQNVIVDNCIISGLPASIPDDLSTSWQIGIYGTNSHNITISDTEIFGARWGIGLLGREWIVENCEIYHCLSDGIISTGTADTVFQDNIIHDIRSEQKWEEDGLTADYNSTTRTVTKAAGGIDWSTALSGQYIRLTGDFGSGEVRTSQGEIVSSTATSITITLDDEYGLGDSEANAITKVELFWGHHLDAMQFYNSPSNPNNDIYVYTNNIIIRRNIMYNIEHHALLWNSFTEDPSNTEGISNVTIENNLCYNIALSGLPDQTFALEDSSFLTIVNNTLDGWIALTHSCYNTTMANNIMHTLYVDDNINPSTFDILKNNIVNVDRLDAPSVSFDETNIILNNDNDYQSLFNNYDNSDYTLHIDSIAVDFGSPEFAPPTDIDGVNRDIGPPDAGAYEFISNPSITSIIIYSRNDLQSLPSNNDNNLANIFTTQEYSDVESDDGNRVAQTSAGEYPVFLFKNKNTSQENISITWNGRSDTAPSDSTIYLQIFNRTGLTWETLDSDNITGANTDFTLTATKTTDLGDYFDANFWVSCRIYQQLI